ncbi:MAG: hypothetical protein GY839_19935 [candidate division Zixibacteria bacterium]|nr:hypothetical protein [candidate division Zixibacteria bacterium]
MLVFELSYDFLMLNVVFKKVPAKFVNIGTNSVRIPDNFRIAHEDYLDNTDSLNAIYLADNNLLVIAGRMNFLNHNSNYDLTNAFKLMNSRAGMELFDYQILDVCGDSVWYSLYVNDKYWYLSLVRDFSEYQAHNMRFLIPSKGIMFEIEAVSKEIEDIVPLLKDFLYYDQKHFYWNMID